VLTTTSDSNMPQVDDMLGLRNAKISRPRTLNYRPKIQNIQDID